jgi:uncharacterized protein
MKLYPKTFKGIVVGILRIAIIVFAAISAIMFFAQERLIFFPSTLRANYKFKFEMPFEERIFEVDGDKIDSLHFQAPHSRGLIIYFHGNAGDLSSWEQLHQVAAAAMKEAIKMAGDAGRVVVYGRSIGTGRAVKLAKDFKPAALILESPYLSLESVARGGDFDEYWDSLEKFLAQLD